VPNLYERSDVQESKRCSRCGESKPVLDFTRSKQTPDGFFPWCRVCANANRQALRAANPEANKAYHREWYAAHADRQKAKVHAHAQKNSERYNGYKRAWRDANPAERKAAQRKWRQANRDKVNLATGRRRALRMSAPTIPFTLDQLAGRLSYFGRLCWLCGIPANAVDHVKPLSKGGWHCLSNLRPICTACNTRKKDRWPLT